MMMRMNINEYVWVKLTDNGKKQLNKKGTFSSSAEVGGGWYKFPLWEAMRIFGDATFLGGPVFFESGDVHLVKPVTARQ